VQILLQLALETRAGIQCRFPALNCSASFRQVCHGHNTGKCRVAYASSKSDVLDVTSLRMKRYWFVWKLWTQLYGFFSCVVMLCAPGDKWRHLANGKEKIPPCLTTLCGQEDGVGVYCTVLPGVTMEAEAGMTIYGQCWGQFKLAHCTKPLCVQGVCIYRWMHNSY